MKRNSTRQWLAENQRITALCNKLARWARSDHPEDVQDVLQDTFEAFCKGKREVDDWGSYVSKIFYRKFMRAAALRRRYLANLGALGEDIEQLGSEPAADPACQVQDEQSRELLKQQVANLTPRLRATLELHLQDLSNEEIAERLGISVAGVRKNLNRGLVILMAGNKSVEDDHEDK